MESYIVKVQHENSLRRLTLSRGDELVFSYAQLVRKARELFQFPPTTELVLTYVDKEGDVVTMAEDQDLKDALVLQSLNPLRLTITTINRSASIAADIKIDSQLDVEKPKSDTEMAESSGAVQSGQDNDLNEKATSAPARPTTESKGDPGAPDTAETNESEHVLHREHVLHHGVKCDGCGKTPIAGPRFKSNKKTDYDLCRSCFEGPGVDPNDFFKIERRFHRFGHPFAGRVIRLSPAFSSRTPNSCPPNSCPPNSCAPTSEGVDSDRCARRCAPVAAEKPAADPRGSVHDGVSCDGCRITPIVGPRFRSTTKFNYDLCLNCFQKSDRIGTGEYSRMEQPQMAADFHPLVLQRLARLALPYGTMNGRRGIWVYNPMAVPNQTVGQSIAGEKTAASPGDAQVNQANPAPQIGPKQVPTAANVTAAAAEPAETGAPQVDAEGEENTGSKVHSAAIEKQAVTESQHPPVNNSAADELATFEGLLAKLGAMGFTDQTLNEELLKKNKLDLRTTLDDLCAAEEWDPILEELQAMGFYDSAVNRRLMVKNNGSMKRVVKELVQLSKEPSRKPRTEIKKD